jgi:hypothetical protein
MRIGKRGKKMKGSRCFSDGIIKDLFHCIYRVGALCLAEKVA